MLRATGCRRLALSSPFLEANHTPYILRTWCESGAWIWRRDVGTVAARKLPRHRRFEDGLQDGRSLGSTVDDEQDLRESDREGTVLRTSLGETLKSDLRSLLREFAQPVAVVTSFMPSSKDNTRHSAFDNPPSTVNHIHNENASLYHGATLSSFTSIAMDPYPLVTFALRIPSRMASALTTLAKSSSFPTSLDSGSPAFQAHMVINILSESQAPTAVKFSRPDLHPTPFHGAPDGTEGVTYSLTSDCLPVIDGALGALSCQLVGGPIPLYDLDYLAHGAETGGMPRMPVFDKGDVGSELFIARVLRLEKVRNLASEAELEHEEERTLPLLYHRRSYTTCRTKS